MEKTYKSENRIQQECYMWFHNTYPHLRGCLFAVPNGGARSAVEGKLLKATGVVPGVSDMILMVNGIATCFELKNKFGKQSEAQVSWESKIRLQGFKYYIIRSLGDFKRTIELNELI